MSCTLLKKRKRN